MWKLGLNHEQMAAIDSIVDKWRDGYNRKDQELYEVHSLLPRRLPLLSLQPSVSLVRYQTMWRRPVIRKRSRGHNGRKQQNW